MKQFLFALFLICATRQLGAQEALQSFNSLSKKIQVEDQGGLVVIHLQAGTYLKGPRFIINQIAPEDGKSQKIVFEYFFIQDLVHSSREWDPVTITWTTTKGNWIRWNKDKQLYVLKQNDIGLSPDEIDAIKRQW